MPSGTLKASRKLAALLLACSLSAGAVRAGVSVRQGEGIFLTDTQGVSFVEDSGVTATGIDQLLAFNVNGITATGIDGVTATGIDGVTATGIDGVTATGIDAVTYAGGDALAARGLDALDMAAADGVTVTGIDGLTVTAADGSVSRADSLLLRRAEGVTVTGIDGVTATGIDGVTATGIDTLHLDRADGVTATGIDGVTAAGAEGVTATGIDGRVFSIEPSGIRIEGADGVTATGIDGVTATGIDGVTATGIDGVTATGIDGVTATGIDGVTATGIDDRQRTGLRSVDPELALLLDRVTDDSNVNAAVVYHRQPGDEDLAALRSFGILGGTRYRALPIIAVTATRGQLVNVSRLPAVRSIYGNRTLQTTADPYLAPAGAERVPRDSELTSLNAGRPLTGQGVTVAVMDTGLDATHGDLSGRVVRNVKLADTQSLAVGFAPPVNVEDVPNTDQVYGHGTFVAGMIAGSGAHSGGAYAGAAPGAKLVGLSAGDLSLFHVLAGFDYLLSRPELGVRVVNCSFSANTVYDEHDPVNVATHVLTESGVNVVFSAGNSGPGLHTLNPYAAAPWVVSVGSTDHVGRLADFSARGEFGGPSARPTLVAPGVNVVGLRSSGTNVLSVSGRTSPRLSPAEALFYTTASGTSFSAPQVAGAIALMLEANPALTPAEVRDILQRTATPLPPYYRHEVGAGMLNAHAAALEAVFPERLIGVWRASLDRGQVRFFRDPLQQFGGATQTLSGYETFLRVPEDALLASVQIAWGPVYSTNDLGLSLSDPGGVRRASSNQLNLPGLTGRRERAAVKSPAPGRWRVGVTNTLGPVGTPQPFDGVLEVARAEYSPLADLDGLSAQERGEVYQNLRSFVMWPSGASFRPGFGVTRAELARTLVLGARVPQYAPGQSAYADVHDRTTTLFVESVQAAPGGALFADATPGGPFRPDEMVDRLTGTVALVRASGLRAEAEARAGALLSVADAGAIPWGLRGYVAVALERGLLTAGGGAFRPQFTLTRLELARAMSVLAKRVE